MRKIEMMQTIGKQHRFNIYLKFLYLLPESAQF